MGAILNSAFFSAVGAAFSLIPNFSERKKNQIIKETAKLAVLEGMLHEKLIAFNEESISDEILGIAHTIEKQTDLLKQMYLVFAEELKGGE